MQQPFRYFQMKFSQGVYTQVLFKLVSKHGFQRAKGFNIKILELIINTVKQIK